MNNKQSVNSFASTTNITLYTVDVKLGDEVLTSVGFPNGECLFVYK